MNSILLFLNGQQKMSLLTSWLNKVSDPYVYVWVSVLSIQCRQVSLFHTRAQCHTHAYTLHCLGPVHTDRQH